VDFGLWNCPDKDMFKRLFIANRGEIAVRIIRACRDLGISPVVAYSEADRDSLHVRLADHAVHIGEAPARDSYLSLERIIEAARFAQAEALHPGYGFLAENEALARACEKSGVVFVGPSAQALRIMGSKLESRAAAIRAGVSPVPGSQESLDSVRHAERQAGEIGYPVMLKASGGGGGKGLRLVHSARELASALGLARREAEAAFGDSSIYMEKYLSRARHIEVQVLGDRNGNLIHLGERECSIQRRHQKVLEECPSPMVDEAMRQELGESALALARAVGYHSAGTVEFLVDASSSKHPPPCYFLEMNTRLQVEHPITEMVTGVDLVCEQIRVAAGEPLSLTQADVRLSGWAIEARIYAEDPDHNFFPSPGRISSLVEPSGPGIRIDSGVYAGFTIPVEYDPLVSKLIARGKDREEAIARLNRALSEYRVSGVKTTIPFFQKLLQLPEYLRGDLHTGLIDAHREQLRSELPEEALMVPVAAAALFEQMEPAAALVQAPQPTRSWWKTYGRFR
jgi:acetyl-CoA carboxylase, biotin carboxylase subunit